MPIPVTRYKCEHCQKKVYASKYTARKHEQECFYNPEVKACGTCEYREFEQVGLVCYLLKKLIGTPVTNCEHWELAKYDYGDEL